MKRLFRLSAPSAKQSVSVPDGPRARPRANTVPRWQALEPRYVRSLTR